MSDAAGLFSFLASSPMSSPGCGLAPAEGSDAIVSTADINTGHVKTSKVRRILASLCSWVVWTNLQTYHPGSGYENFQAASSLFFACAEADSTTSASSVLPGLVSIGSDVTCRTPLAG